MTHYEIQHDTICQGWVNCWSVDDQPETFATYKAAKDALKEFFQERQESFEAGDIVEPEDPEQWRIAEIWDWESRLDEIDYAALDQYFIEQAFSDDDRKIKGLIEKYRQASIEERDTMNTVTIFLTGWTIPTLVANSQGDEYRQELKERF